MRINENVLHILKKNHVVTTEQVEALGMTRASLHAYTQGGALARIRWGVYALAEEAESVRENYLPTIRGIYSHGTAAFLNGLLEERPEKLSATFPNSLPLHEKDFLNYYVRDDIFEDGAVKLETPYGNTIRYYGPERTVCDMMRSLRRSGRNEAALVTKALQERGNMDQDLLMRYVRYFKIERIVEHYMGACTEKELP